MRSGSVKSGIRRVAVNVAPRRSNPRSVRQQGARCRACIGSRARAHETPSPACGGRLGWGHSAVAPDTVLRHRPTPPSRPPPARAEGGVSRAHPKSRASARSPFPRLRGKVGMGQPKSRASARSPFPRLRGKAGMGALGGRTRHRASPPPDAPLPTSPRSRGGRGFTRTSEVTRERTKPLPPLAGEGWDGGTRQSQPAPHVATARCFPASYCLRQGPGSGRAGDFRAPGR
jgi:hypothetical protein